MPQLFTRFVFEKKRKKRKKIVLSYQELLKKYKYHVCADMLWHTASKVRDNQCIVVAGLLRSIFQFLVSTSDCRVANIYQAAGGGP